MKNRNVSATLLVVLLLLAGAMWYGRLQPRAREAVQRKPGQLWFTPAALCSMECLKLHRSDAAFVLATGLVLYHKSNRRAQPCPVYVIQGSSAAGITYRLRVEQCTGRSVVVAISRPGTEISCGCDNNNEQHPPLVR
jgi:hypothetical protein